MPRPTKLVSERDERGVQLWHRVSTRIPGEHYNHVVRTRQQFSSLLTSAIRRQMDGSNGVPIDASPGDLVKLAARCIVAAKNRQSGFLTAAQLKVIQDQLPNPTHEILPLPDP